MCDKAVLKDPGMLLHVPDKKKLERALMEDSYYFFDVPNSYKIQEMCHEAIK